MERAGDFPALVSIMGNAPNTALFLGFKLKEISSQLMTKKQIVHPILVALDHEIYRLISPGIS